MLDKKDRKRDSQGCNNWRLNLLVFLWHCWLLRRTSLEAVHCWELEVLRGRSRLPAWLRGQRRWCSRGSRERTIGRFEWCWWWFPRMEVTEGCHQRPRQLRCALVQCQWWFDQKHWCERAVARLRSLWSCRCFRCWRTRDRPAGEWLIHWRWWCRCPERRREFQSHKWLLLWRIFREWRRKFADLVSSDRLLENKQSSS